MRISLGAADVEHVRHVDQLQLRQVGFNFLHTLLIILVVNSFHLNFALDAFLELLDVTTQLIILFILLGVVAKVIDSSVSPDCFIGNYNSGKFRLGIILYKFSVVVRTDQLKCKKEEYERSVIYHSQSF